MSIDIMTQVWKAATTTESRELLALLALADWSDDWGGSYPSYATIARKIRVSKRQTAIRVVARLVEHGEVFKPEDHGTLKSNLFIVLTGTTTPDEVKARVKGALKARGITIPPDLDKQLKEVIGKRCKGTSSGAGTSKEVASPVADTTASPVADTRLVPARGPNTLLIRQIDTSENGGGTSSLANSTPSAPAPSAAAFTDSGTATADDLKTAQAADSIESDILDALETMNRQIRANNGRPITGTKTVARKLAARGETRDTMRAAWRECKANGDNPIGAFMKWINEAWVPPQAEGFETRVNPETGERETWVLGQGWMPVGRVA